MYHAAHLVTFDEVDENRSSSIEDISLLNLIPEPKNLKYGNKSEWRMKHWNNAENLKITMIESDKIEMESDHGPCLNAIEIWAKQHKFSGTYEAMSADLRDHVCATFFEGELEKVDKENNFHRLCFELMNHHYFEIVDVNKIGTEKYTELIAEAIKYYTVFDVAVVDGQVEITNGEIKLGMKYNLETDSIVFHKGEKTLIKRLFSDIGFNEIESIVDRMQNFIRS
jgi:hypothetical protein